MSNTYNWKVSALDRYPTQNELSGVVHTIHWRMSATSDQTNENGNPYTAETYGAYNLGEPDADTFTDYTELTQEIVEGWLEEGLDVVQIKSGLDDQINDKITPTNLTDAPPWTITSAEPEEE